MGTQLALQSGIFVKFIIKKTLKLPDCSDIKAVAYEGKNKACQRQKLSDFTCI